MFSVAVKYQKGKRILDGCLKQKRLPGKSQRPPGGNLQRDLVGQGYADNTQSVTPVKCKLLHLVR